MKIMTGSKFGCIPYLSRWGETLVKQCMKKIQCNLTQSVNFIVIYENIKIAYSLPNKDKIPKLSKSEPRIGKTERCLKNKLSKHSDPTTSAVGHHFYNCENLRLIVSMHHLFDHLNDKTIDVDEISIFIANLIINNSWIIHSPNSWTSNFL